MPFFQTKLLKALRALNEADIEYQNAAMTQSPCQIWCRGKYTRERYRCQQMSNPRCGKDWGSEL